MPAWPIALSRRRETAAAAGSPPSRGWSAVHLFVSPTGHDVLSTAPARSRHASRRSRKEGDFSIRDWLNVARGPAASLCQHQERPSRQTVVFDRFEDRRNRPSYRSQKAGIRRKCGAWMAAGQGLPRTPKSRTAEGWNRHKRPIHIGAWTAQSGGRAAVRTPVRSSVHIGIARQDQSRSCHPSPRAALRRRARRQPLQPILHALVIAHGNVEPHPR
jgi:hypothetical protein